MDIELLELDEKMKIEIKDCKEKYTLLKKEVKDKYKKLDSTDLATKARKLRENNPYARGSSMKPVPVGHSKWSSASKEYLQALR